MDKSKLIPHQAADSDTTPIKFWGTIVANALASLLIGYYLINIIRRPESFIGYVAIGLFLLFLATALSSIVLTIRGKQELGIQIAFYAGLGTSVTIAAVFQGRTLSASVSYLAIGLILIFWLLPEKAKRRNIIILGAGELLMWVFEWVNPSWRLASEALKLGFTSAIILGIVVAVIVVRQAWSGNIRVKLVTSFTVIALISVGVVGTVMYASYRNQVREDARQRLLNIVSITALQQDGDLFATIQTEEDMQGDAYQKMQAVNHAILATDRDLAYIFSVRVDDQGKMEFVVDSGLEEGYEPLEVGVVYDDPSELLAENAFNLDRSIVEKDFYTDEYGTFLSAYAPIYKSDGTRAGIVGVDIFAGKVLAEERAVLLQILGTTLGTMLIVTLIGLWLGSTFVAPVINLSRTTQKIIEGDLNARATVETEDEVGDLARAFNQMTSQLQETLQGLEQHVAERTRHLVLAAGVGRAVSQVRDLDVLLTDACELILKEFNLYYVQVYLTAADQKTLNLEAGTGEVGAQLVRREHRLPLDVNSINGRAAVEKHSVVISDTTQSATFRQNPLLPETRGEMAVPLIVADKVVGVLDMQSREVGVLDEEFLPAFEALAGQLAVAIQNANLLNEANEARAEVEKQARRLVRQSWGEYMDAIHTPEQIGFTFNQKEVIPFAGSNESSVSENAIFSSISVAGEPLGSLTVNMGDSSDKDQAVELVSSVAQQMARQIENLRLLESAERYRQKAELAMNRTTLERWRQYTERQQQRNIVYMYDTREVRPLEQEPEVPTLTLPIKDLDNTIGRFSIPGLEEQDQGSLEIVDAIVERLSSHIAALSQYDQTQSALAQSEKLFTASSQISQATGLQELVAAIITTLNVPAMNRALLTTFEYAPLGDIEQLTIIGNWWNGSGHEVTPIGTRYPREVMRVMPMFVSPVPVFFNDTFDDERVDATTLELVVKKLNLRSVAVLPLFSANKQIGALVLEGEEPHHFTQQEMRLFSSLAPQIATVVENRRQFEQAQRQAEREAMLNAISQKIQSATSVEAVLQIAARELGRALDASKAVAQLSAFKRNGDNGNNGNNHHEQ